MDHFEKVLEQYTPMISAIIRKLHIYRDFEVYRQAGKVGLWQAYNRFNDTKGNFTPFAYRSIYGAILDELKHEARFTSQVTVVENENFEELIDSRWTDELPEWLDRITLTAEERKLLEVLFVEGRSLSEQAVLYSLSLAGMKKRRERLLKKVRRQLPKDKADIFRV
ncbi:sigma-70 family RNA polymerase sigma factor [Planomicrobium sp. CPCC 101079]|uniref:sigma-70 family RNA polymerase sigma factor n=1 Tax=Planomicrobium sp. CPCC 101079 TaxID=2599618 RepID=UPI0011B46E8F|nr:sigma-70 family RNA polymerase sigma factor [Planomicrobium sp. CPCC 101079]TWT04955.1 sigma-70 family RNA polymerase sigma factor [Planomicrobium sp. CPCC 101079]